MFSSVADTLLFLTDWILISSEGFQIGTIYDQSWATGYALTEGDPLKRPTYQELLSLVKIVKIRFSRFLQILSESKWMKLIPIRIRHFPQLRPDARLVARPLGPVDLASSGLLLLTNKPELRLALGGEIIGARVEAKHSESCIQSLFSFSLKLLFTPSFNKQRTHTYTTRRSIAQIPFGSLSGAWAACELSTWVSISKCFWLEQRIFACHTHERKGANNAHTSHVRKGMYM